MEIIADMNKNLRYLTTAAVIAALYAGLTITLAPISYGPIQLRVSEILTVLPFYTPAAIPGLFVGCVLSNLYSPLGIIDIAFGSCATLLAAFLTRRVPVRWLAPLPPVICNGLIVGAELHYFYKVPVPLLPTILWVACGEAVVCYIGGLPFMLALDRVTGRLFPDGRKK
jgi:uncharacterized membrane protein